MGGEDLHLLPPEHRGKIYCDYAPYGPVYRGKADTRANSGNAVVVTGGSGFGGDADDVPGGERTEREEDTDRAETAADS